MFGYNSNRKLITFDTFKEIDCNDIDIHQIINKFNYPLMVDEINKIYKYENKKLILVSQYKNITIKEICEGILPDHKYMIVIDIEGDIFFNKECYDIFLKYNFEVKIIEILFQLKKINDFVVDSCVKVLFIESVQHPDRSLFIVLNQSKELIIIDLEYQQENKIRVIENVLDFIYCDRFIFYVSDYEIYSFNYNNINQSNIHKNLGLAKKILSKQPFLGIMNDNNIKLLFISDNRIDIVENIVFCENEICDFEIFLNNSIFTLSMITSQLLYKYNYKILLSYPNTFIPKKISESITPLAEPIYFNLPPRKNIKSALSILNSD